MSEIKNVTVLGCGIMGIQIAMQAALHGYPVICCDISQKMLDNAVSFSQTWLEKRVRNGKMSEEQAERVRKDLSFTTEQALAAANADIVVEAVADVIHVKKKALSSMDAMTPAHCIYASNSSYIVSSHFADAVRDPSKVINVHFFNPALVMKIVEVVKAPHVSEDTFQKVFAFVESIGKTPITIEKEIYGFVVNRIFAALTREACYLLDSGIANAADIDQAVKGALGHSMGPFETLDMTGIDLEYSVYMQKFRLSGDKGDLPAACLTERYAKGDYGRKTGRGFYEYEKKKE